MSDQKSAVDFLNKSHVPGGFDAATSAFELDYWENFGGVAAFDLHFAAYSKCFPLVQIDFERETILDIGSGAISVLEKIAPASALVTPYDLLADDFNRIAPNKKFPIKSRIPDSCRFSLITLFNMIDHVNEPGEVLELAARRLQQDGRVWLAVHLYQPHGPKGHPQNFSCSSIIDLISSQFHIESCGIIRETVPIPYLWFGELRKKSLRQPIWILAWFKLKVYSKFWALQLVRAAAKLAKAAGLKKQLPKEWRF